jgi:hypothetical protein
VTVTDPGLKPETILNDQNGWNGLVGRKWISNPLDVMFDIDDVIFPTMMSIHELARQAGYHNNDVDPSWSGWEPYNIPEQAYWDLWSDFALSGGYVNTEPIPGAIEAMRRLYFEGHRIHLVTARGFMNHASDIRTWTPQWVEEFGVPWHSLTFARDKVGAMHELEIEFGGSPWARDVAEERPPFFDYGIDDSPRNVDALRAARVNCYLLDHVHNKSHVAEHRVASVDDFVDMILEERQ